MVAAILAKIVYSDEAIIRGNSVNDQRSDIASYGNREPRVGDYERLARYAAKMR
jgi:hypothetical protein